MEEIQKYKVLKTYFSLLENDEISFNRPNSDYYFNLIVHNRTQKELYRGNENGVWCKSNVWNKIEPYSYMKDVLIPYFQAMEFKINFRPKHETNQTLWQENTNNWYENERMRIIQDFINLGIIEKIN